MNKILNSVFYRREDEDLPHYRLSMGDLGKIHKAVVNGEFSKINKKISFRRWNKNEKDQMGRTPLHLACVLGNVRMVELLVEKNCLLNPRDQLKRTPLFKAVQCKHVTCSQVLLEHGADPNLVDIHGFSALHYAVHDNNPLLVELLLEYKANLEKKDKSGQTPLILAAKGNKPEMVELLLKNKANVNAVDNNERNSLMFAVHHDSLDMVQLLLDHGGDVFSVDSFGQSALTHARYYGFPKAQHLVCAVRKESNKNNPQNKDSVDEDTESNTESRTSRITSQKMDSQQKMTSKTHNEESDTSVDTSLISLPSKSGTDGSKSSFNDETKSSYEKLPEELDHIIIAESGNIQTESNEQTGERKDPAKVFSGSKVLKDEREPRKKSSPLMDKENKAAEKLSLSSRISFPKIGRKNKIAFQIQNAESDTLKYTPLSSLPSKSGTDGPRSAFNGDTKKALHTPNSTDVPEGDHINEKIENNDPRQEKCVVSNYSPTQLVEQEGLIKSATSKGEKGIDVAERTPDEQYNTSLFNAKESPQSRGKGEMDDTQADRKIESISENLPEELDHIVRTESGKIQSGSNGQVGEREDPAKVFSGSQVLKDERKSTKNSSPHTDKENEAGGKLSLRSWINFPKIGRKNKITFQTQNTESDTLKDTPLSSLPSKSGTDGPRSEFNDETKKAPHTSFSTDVPEGDHVKERIENKDSRQEKCVVSSYCPTQLVEHEGSTKSATSKGQKGKGEMEDTQADWKIESISEKLPERLDHIVVTESEKIQSGSNGQIGEREIPAKVFSGSQFLKEERKPMKKSSPLMDKENKAAGKISLSSSSTSPKMGSKHKITFRTRNAESDTEKDTPLSSLPSKSGTDGPMSSFNDETQEGSTKSATSKGRKGKEEMENIQADWKIEVSDDHEVDLLHQSHVLQEEIVMPKLKVEKVKTVSQEKSKTHTEDTNIIKEENCKLKKIKRLIERIYEITQQLKHLTDEMSMLKSLLDSEKQISERCQKENQVRFGLMTEEISILKSKLKTKEQIYKILQRVVPTYHILRLVTARSDSDQRKASNRNLEFSLQREIQGRLHLHEKINVDMCSLKRQNETLSQCTDTTESQENSLQMEIIHEKHDMGKNKSHGSKLLRQLEGHKGETDLLYQSEQDNGDAYVGNQNSRGKVFSQQQSEVMLLQQQLDDEQSNREDEVFMDPSTDESSIYSERQNRLHYRRMMYLRETVKNAERLEKIKTNLECKMAEHNTDIFMFENSGTLKFYEEAIQRLKETYMLICEYSIKLSRSFEQHQK